MYTVSFGIVTAGKNAIIEDRIFLNMFSPSFFYIHSFNIYSIIISLPLRIAEQSGFDNFI